MKLIDALNITKGALAKNTLVHILINYHIYNDKIQAQNGSIAIDCACQGFDKKTLSLPGKALLSAAKVCGENIGIKITDTTVVITGNNTSIKLPVNNSDFPVIKKPVKLNKIAASLLDILKRLRPFISLDINKPVMESVAIRNNYAYAADNKVIARTPIDLLDMVIPVFMINELLRIGIEPIGYNSTDLALTFKLSSDVWIQSTLLTGEWPDVEKFFGKRQMPLIPQAEMIAAVEAVLPFCADEKFPIVQLSDAGITTGAGQMSAAVADLHLPESKWNANVLLTVLQEATHFKLDDWPEACRWKGDGIEGVAIGVR